MAKKKILGNTEESHPDVAEARRYIANARQILREKAKKEGEFYKDAKYVKMACHTAWVGVLYLLKKVFEKELNEILKKGQREDINDYKRIVAKHDKKLLDNLDSAYTLLHIYGSYDGNRNVTISKTGLEQGEKVITWLETRISKKE